MLGLAKSLLRGLGVDSTRAYEGLSAMSVRAAIREQGFRPLVDRLAGIVPDLTEQYTHGFDAGEYDRYRADKTRGMHAFQVQAALDALAHIGGSGLIAADIGDSSGNHGLYLKALAPDGQLDKVVSVNLDPVAVDKVRAKGGEAVLARAEEMDLEGIRPDLFMSFQMVEHLTDPVRFLHGLAAKGSAGHMLLTVPYRRRSRFGGSHLRLAEADMPRRMTAEDVHVFEFSPDDWLLLARFAGWKPVFTRLYYQYPRYSPLRLTKPLWAKLDFEGFLALFLERDLSVAEHYADW